MVNKKISRIFEIGFYLGISLATLVLLYFRFQYGIFRYFDIDEFAYLHWGHNLVSGLSPYVDFFYFLPPFYLYVIASLFFFVSKTGFLLILARELSFVIFVICAVVLFVLTVQIASVRTAILALFVFAFLPMPLDKWLEIRPDGLATLLSLVGVVLLVQALKKSKQKHFFFSGFFISLSVLVLPKVVFFAVVALGIVLLHAYWEKKLGSVVMFLSGSVIPIVIMLLLFAKYGDVSKALYLVTKVSSDSTAVLGKKFPRESDLIFRPNGAYYGLEWYNLAWKMNLFVWVFACVWSIKRLISFLDEKDFKISLSSLLVALIFWLNFVMYVVFVPLKHPQYLIPMTPFVAFYFAEFLLHAVLFLKKHAFAGVVSSSFFLLFFGLIFPFYGAWEMYNVKLKWKNDDQIEYYTNLYSYLPPNEPVFDLSGETVFYPEGYYFCCIPYGQYEEALTFKYPELESELRRKKVKFVHIQDKGRIGVLPPRQQKVISDHYIPYRTLVTSSIYVSGAIVKSLQNNQETRFDLIAAGPYVLLWQGIRAVSPGLEAWVKIDGVPVISNPVQLTAGSHTITIAGTGEMTIRYEW